MNFKDKLQENWHKLKELWSTGKVQRSSRIVYDVFWNVILFFFIAIIIGGFFAVGIGAGYFASLVKDEEKPTYASMEKDIYNYEETSEIYFADDVYAGDVKSDLHREETSLEDVSDTLLDAVIATEDQYFRKHHGVVPKAIIRAIVQEATNSETKTGGSTLTQQLIKNQMLTNEVSFDRKAKEIMLALRLERSFNKDEILEAYLNIIPYGKNSSGDNVAGIQTASQGIFGVDAADINLPQAAYLAGLPQSPSAYTPFVKSGELKDEEDLQRGINRMKSVLKRMYDAKYIDKEAYEEALDYDIVADFNEPKDSPIDKRQYFYDEVEKRAIKILKKKLVEDDGYETEDLKDDNELDEQYDELAERDLRMSGYQIKTTIDKDIYDAFQKVAKDYEYYGPDRTFKEENEETGEMEEFVEPVQTGAVLIENSSGRIISFVGGREYTNESQVNFAMGTNRPIGSTAKPLVVYAPAMELGELQPGSAVADIPKSYGSWSPGNYGGGNYGIVSARDALANSYNRPAVSIYESILGENPSDNYLPKMGIDVSNEEKQNLSLALGGMSKGIKVEENVNAYTTFSNEGEFIEGYMIEEITDRDGEIIYEHESDPVEVFSSQTAYLTLDMMRDVIRAGTASYLDSQLKHGGVDWAGKTGTTDDYKDAWFVGTNPNVTMGTWIGYETPHSIQCPGCSLSYSQRNLKLWSELVNTATDVDPELMAPEDNFKQPDGIVNRSYCEISGMLPSDLCEKAGLVASDIYNSKYVPTKEDDSLVGSGGKSLVVVDGKEVVAGPKTPQEFISGEGKGLAFNPEFLKRKEYDKLSDISMLFPRKNREKWEKIGTSGADVSDSIEDDGKDPSAPGSVSSSGSNLTWNKSSSKDVVGYRIFKADKSGGNFELIGHTVDTSYSLPDGYGVYHVKAVDYFGRESSGSKETEVGEKTDDKDKDKEKDKEDKEKDDKKDEDKDKEKDNDKDKEKEKDNKKDKEKDEDKKKDDKKDDDKDEDEDKDEDKDKEDD